MPPDPTDLGSPASKEADEPHHQGCDVKRYFYETHDELRAHLRDFVDAYNFARRLKTLRGLTPYDFICKAWTSQPQRFIISPLQRMPDQTPNRLPTGFKDCSNLNRIDGEISRDLLDGEAIINQHVEWRALDRPANSFVERLLQQAIQLVSLA
jgi:hypothetical protein